MKQHALLSVVLIILTPVSAIADKLQGPAANAVKTWFTTDRSLQCYDRQGNDAGCEFGPDANVFVKYAPSGDTAVAFATYVNDPTGNAEQFAVAIFRKNSNGWQFLRNVQGPSGKSASNVTFRGDNVGFDTEVLRKNDGRCCPTGRKHWTIPLR